MNRPNPDELLEKIQKDSEKEQRGKLKIFFGACAGVGKTFAMLAAAHMLRAQGLDVLVGVVETHGRDGTVKQLAGLDCLPPKVMQYRDRELTEFDIDAALARKPALILMDELAHSNVEGSRHPKRWQDVEELLAAGIDVYTTLNVQHLESLNDVVGQITGIRVMETLPDKVFDMADEVTLVDLSPEELLRRLQDGQVYRPHQAEQAGKNFFRKGNLIALREMALRRTADRVDVQMREYRADQSIQQVWQARERILLCVGPGAGAEQLVRVAARLAASMKADWLAVYVETPALQRLSDAERDTILKTLRLAHELGAETATLSGTSIGKVLLGYAHSRNASRVVVGKPGHSFLYRLFRPSVVDELTAVAADVDIHIVTRAQEASAEAQPPRRGNFPSIPADADYRAYLWATAACIASSLIAAVIAPFFELVNVVMLYLLAVILISAKFGRWPGIFSSFLSVGVFDFFFVPPKLSFTVSDTQYLLTFAVMLIVALVISNLTSSLRYQAVIATLRERRSRSLYDLGKELASALTASHIVEISVHHLSGIFQSKIAVLLPDSQDKIREQATDLYTGVAMGKDMALDLGIALDIGIAQWVYDHQEEAGLGTYTLPSSPALYLPLKAPMRTRGVLVICPQGADSKYPPGMAVSENRSLEAQRMIFLPEQRQLLDTFATQIALAIERVHYVEVAQDALISMESERLRNSLLSAISHDLRTPLTTILGIASSLKEQDTEQDNVHKDLVEALHEQAFRMNSLVTNLLDMARLQSGKVMLNKQWYVLDEVVGTALRAMQPQLKRHRVEVHLPAELPLLQFDAVLIERVLCNLLDNATKYAPADSLINISAQVHAHEVLVTVSDNGPGLPPGMETQVFDKFTRGEKESAKPGVGLGLSICQAIIQAHDGRIWASNHSPHGAMFVFSLPIGVQPTLPSLE
ncbi:MAG: DUF4118 domain-containing protein [Candidatus Methylopumilus sp.]|jgi:two-component system sensor histidine kinase KdpD